MVKNFLITAMLVASLQATALASESDDSSPRARAKQTSSSMDESALVCTKGANKKLYCKPGNTDEVELTSKNLITLRGPIDTKSASAFIRQFNELQYKSDVSTIYVWVRSPGGSVFAGEYITNVIAGSKKPVVMIVDFAASMAFHIVQFGTKRIMLPSGTLMQHHPSGSANPGQFPNVDSEWNWLKRKTSEMGRKQAAACSKTSYKQFAKNIDRDWWLLADEAEKAGCVDEVTSKIYCSKDLSESVVTETVSLFGMSVEVKWSGCPLELYPRDVRMGSSNLGGPRSELTAEQRRSVENYIQLVADPLTYYHTYGTFNFNIEQSNSTNSISNSSTNNKTINTP